MKMVFERIALVEEIVPVVQRQIRVFVVAGVNKVCPPKGKHPP